ncbi:MAG: RNA-dependent RNA polymerase [Sanya Iflavirus 6]|nr:MAG: RNA-dependent RNA polymerase [Sanya Iflavirus 6]
MDFMAAYMEARLKLNHAIGIRQDSSEWAKLASKMHFHNANQNFLSGDYKNFGPTLSLQVMSYAAKVILEWCKHYYGNETPEQQEDNLVRSLLLNEIIESVHLCFDNLYQVLCGAPSGSPITVILNEMVNEIYMYCAYHHLAITHKSFFSKDLSSVDCYHRHVLKCGYGDDIILNVHDDVKHFFNHYNISQFFLKHNIGYTDAEKTGSDHVEFKHSIEEITFLKRSFKPHPIISGQFLAPLNIDYSVKEVLNWRSDRLPPKIGTEQSIEACSMNAYGHGPEIHNNIRQKCINALIKIKSDKHLRTWKELDRIFFSDFYPKDPVSSGSGAEESSQNSLLVSQNFTVLDLDCLVLE